VRAAGWRLLAVSFVGYVAGWLPAHVPPHELPALGRCGGALPRQSGSPTGWGWLALLDRGDMLGLAGIGVLAGCSVVALLALVPMYASRRDRTFVALCLLEAGVLLAAASGVVA